MESRKKVDVNSRKRRAPASTPEGRESQLISLAIDLAEAQLRNGTASSQVIAHFLKLGSSTERQEQQIREQQKRLMEAKTESIQSAKKMDELYINAINAMKTYSGNRGEIDD